MRRVLSRERDKASPGNGTNLPRPDGGESTSRMICKEIVPERVNSICTD